MQQSFPCDRVLPDFNEAYHRGVTIAAPPSMVFRWLCQLRVAPYSYEWIDNLGRHSPQELTPELETLERGQPVMTIFELVDFEQDRHLTLRLRKPGIFPPLAVSYLIVAQDPRSCRLLAKLVMRFGRGLGDRLSRSLAPWLDWVMMRRQLLNLKRLAEGVQHGPE
jgi:hypothetical protein